MACNENQPLQGDPMNTITKPNFIIKIEDFGNGIIIKWKIYI
jgi:hypothetical protein